MELKSEERGCITCVFTFSCDRFSSVVKTSACYDCTSGHMETFHTAQASFSTRFPTFSLADLRSQKKMVLCVRTEPGQTL